VRHLPRGKAVERFKKALMARGPVTIRRKALTLLTMLITNNLNPYTTPYKFFEVFTSLVFNDLSVYKSWQRNYVNVNGASWCTNNPQNLPENVSERQMEIARRFNAGTHGNRPKSRRDGWYHYPTDDRKRYPCPWPVSQLSRTWSHVTLAWSDTSISRSDGIDSKNPNEFELLVFWTI